MRMTKTRLFEPGVSPVAKLIDIGNHYGSAFTCQAASDGSALSASARAGYDRDLATDFDLGPPSRLRRIARKESVGGISAAET